MSDTTWADFDDFIKPTHLKEPRTMTIARWGKKQVNQQGSREKQTRPVLWFKEWERPAQFLFLSAAMREQLAEFFGDDPDDCVGKRITLKRATKGNANFEFERATQVAPTNGHTSATRQRPQLDPATLNRGQAFNALVDARKRWSNEGGMPNPIDRVKMGKMTTDELLAELAIAEKAIAELQEHNANILSDDDEPEGFMDAEHEGEEHE